MGVNLCMFLSYLSIPKSQADTQPNVKGLASTVKCADKPDSSGTNRWVVCFTVAVNPTMRRGVNSDTSHRDAG